MVISCGIDMCETARIEKMLADHGEAFLSRTFTAEELAYVTGRAREREHLAARFAAKEAVMKALGTGWSAGISWLDVSVGVSESGAPSVSVSGKAAEIAAALGISRFHVSLTHTGDYALAMVLAEGR